MRASLDTPLFSVVEAVPEQPASPSDSNGTLSDAEADDCLSSEEEIEQLSNLGMESLFNFSMAAPAPAPAPMPMPQFARPAVHYAAIDPIISEL